MTPGISFLRTPQACTEIEHKLQVQEQEDTPSYPFQNSISHSNKTVLYAVKITRCRGSYAEFR
jgi:hypothetical protein